MVKNYIHDFLSSHSVYFIARNDIKRNKFGFVIFYICLVFKSMKINFNFYISSSENIFVSSLLASKLIKIMIY